MCGSFERDLWWVLSQMKCRSMSNIVACGSRSTNVKLLLCEDEPSNVVDWRWWHSVIFLSQSLITQGMLISAPLNLAQVSQSLASSRLSCIALGLTANSKNPLLWLSGCSAMYQTASTSSLTESGWSLNWFFNDKSATQLIKTESRQLTHENQTITYIFIWHRKQSTNWLVSPKIHHSLGKPHLHQPQVHTTEVQHLHRMTEAYQLPAHGLWALAPPTTTKWVNCWQQDKQMNCTSQ